MKVKYYRHLSEKAWEVMLSALAVAIDRAGSKSNLARKIGIEKNLPTVWSQRIRVVTFEQAIAIEFAYNVSKKSLRPDIDWDYVDLPLEKLPQKMLTALGEFPQRVVET